MLVQYLVRVETREYCQRKSHEMYHIFIEVEQGHVPYIYLFGVLCSNECTKKGS